MKLRLTPEQAYSRKQRLWKLYCEWAKVVRRAFFPDTGGIGLYMHNWYKCNRNEPKLAALAEWIDDSTEDRYRRLEARMKARDVQREHEDHSSRWPEFDPLWCPICNAKRGEKKAA